jgi:hypothetical protein
MSQQTKNIKTEGIQKQGAQDKFGAKRQIVTGSWTEKRNVELYICKKYVELVRFPNL